MLRLLLVILCVASLKARTPNEKLIACCLSDPEIDKTCAHKYCQVNMIRRESVFPFIAECAVKGKTVGNIWNCLSSRADHSHCCKRIGVSDKCMAFCNAHHDAPTDIARYGGCLSEFTKYQQCFSRYLRRHPSYRGHH